MKVKLIAIPIILIIVASLLLRPASKAQSTSGEWETLAPMPIPLSENTASVIDGKIYVVGGYGLSSTDANNSTTLLVYNLSTNEWNDKLTPLPFGRHHLMSASYNGQLYVFGGNPLDAVMDFRESRYVMRYDPANDDWERLGEMPSSRNAGTAITIDDHIYIVGGKGGRGLVPVWRYAPRTDTWEVLAESQFVRDHSSAVVLDNKIYLIGGRVFAGEEDYADVEVYDIETDEWSHIGYINHARAGFGAAVVNGKIYIFGGEQLEGCHFVDGCGSMVSSIEMYDPLENTWKIVGEMPDALHGVPVVTIDGQIYLVGGSSSAGAVANYGNLYRYTPNE